MTNLLIKLFVKNKDNPENPQVRDAYGSLGGGVGIACNLLLFIIKISLGILSGAVSIIADAFNNLSDIGSSAITLLGFKLAKKPADPDHPFGHGRIEYMSAFIVSILIILVGFELFKTSVGKIFAPEDIEVSIITIIGLAVSIIVKLWMNFFNRKIAKIIDSASLKATAQDSLNDCIATSCVLIAVIVCKFTNINIDPYIGLGVAGFILWSGYNAAKETISPLLGEPPKKEQIDSICKIILAHEEFCGIHDLIIHNYGPGRCFASVHVEVPEDINILACHEMIDDCENELNKKLGIEVVIHMDPIATNNEKVMKTSMAVLEKVRKIDKRFTIHDFRMVEGENRTNLIFDVVVPNDLKMSHKDLKKQIKENVAELSSSYRCVIKFDLDFNSIV